jgi:hypothetical protein
MAFGMNGGGAPQNNHLDSIWPRAPRNGKTKRECGRAACFPLTHSVSANPLVSCVRNREEKNERSRESTAGEWPSEPHTARTQTPKALPLISFFDCNSLSHQSTHAPRAFLSRCSFALENMLAPASISPVTSKEIRGAGGSHEFSF